MRRKMAFLAGRPPPGSVLGVVADGDASPTSPSSLPGSRASDSPPKSPCEDLAICSCFMCCWVMQIKPRTSHIPKSLKRVQVQQS